MNSITEKEALEQLLPAHAVAEMIERYGSPYHALFHSGNQEWLKINGVGRTALHKLEAIRTVITKFNQLEAKGAILLDKPKKVYQFMQHIQHKEAEHFYALYLNTKNRLIKKSLISKGTKNASLAGVAEIFTEAVRLNSCSIILVHNHPSGLSVPSTMDIEITKQIRDAGKLLCIELLDHIVIGLGEYTSFAERDMI